VARGYGENVSVQPGRPPLTKRFKEPAWIRLDWAVAAVCAVCVYAVMVKGGGIYIFPLDIRLIGIWIPLLLAVVVALPVGLRRRDPVGSLILALASCSVVVAVGDEISRGPFVPLAFVLSSRWRRRASGGSRSPRSRAPLRCSSSRGSS